MAAAASRRQPDSVSTVTICWPLGLRAEVTDPAHCQVHRTGWALNGGVPPTLPDRSRSSGLLVSLEYPQAERDGPPFSVQEDEVHGLFDHDWQVERLERRPIPADHPGFVAGVSRLETAVYALRRR